MLSLLRHLWEIVTLAAALLTLPGTLELFALSVASFLRLRRNTSALPASAWPVAVIIPAHNEVQGIAACIASLRRCEQTGLDLQIVVIADNCTDGTASAARAAGATVLERTDAQRRGKGYALDFAFTHPQLADREAFLVVDADSEAAQNFLVETCALLYAGADAVQSRYIAQNAADNRRTRLAALALRAFNVVRPRGREKLGVSAGILGNGFGLRRDTLLQVPYTAASVVEDLEYHHALVRAGKRVRFADSTTVRGEMPTGATASETQRSRWEGGRFRMIREAAPALLRDATHGRARCIEPLFELLLLPLGFHVLLLILALTSPLHSVRWIAIFGFMTVLLHLLAAIRVGDSPGSDLLALLSAPFYVLWKLLLLPKLLRSSRAEQAWVRTERNSARPDDTDEVQP